MTDHVIKMPDIGEGIAEVEIVEWHVAVGDQVAEDQILADVMTDKASVQIPSPVFGAVKSLGGQPGDIMAVGANLITIAMDAAGSSHQDGSDTKADAAAASISSAVSEVPVSNNTAAASSAATAPQKQTVAKVASAHQVVATDVMTKPLASPSVRHQARALGIDLYQVQGRDDAGRITHDILKAHVAQASSSSTASVTTQPYENTLPLSDGQHDIPVIGLRRKIAQKMQEAKRHIPHFTYVEEVDVTELENLRVQLNQRWGAERGKLTVLPFLARAIVLALAEFPQINARYNDDANIVTRYDAVHLGVAAQTDSGLMVPVLRHAQSLNLWQCSQGIARLADAARTGKATRDELTGSTITLTSLGALGGIVSTPVINYPEVGIVGVNRIVERPMIVSGAVVARKMMNLSSSFDHRVVDGMDAAQFIQKIKSYLECPATLFIN